MTINLFELSKINTLRLIHLGICLFTSIIILLITIQYRRKVGKNENLGAFYFIALAFLSWAAIDLYRYLGVMTVGFSNVIIKTFSAYNNAFLICSVPFLKNEVNQLRQTKITFNKPYMWALGILLLNVFIVMLYSISWENQNQTSHFVRNFDAFYSAFTFLLVGILLFSSFKHLKETSLAIISGLISAILMVIQFAFSTLFTISHYDLITVISLISHAVLAISFIVLAKSWSIEEQSINYHQHQNILKQDHQNVNRTVENLTQLNSSLQTEIDNLKSRLTYTETELETFKANTIIKELSDREKDVLKHLDKSYSEIAELLFISRETVITHKKNIESKLGIHGKENLINHAKKIGLMTT